MLGANTLHDMINHVVICQPLCQEEHQDNINYSILLQFPYAFFDTFLLIEVIYNRIFNLPRLRLPQIL